MPDRHRPAAASLLAAALSVLFATVLGACSAAPSFDPAGPCQVNGKLVDGRAAGAYPELEAQVPRSYAGRGPNRLDSGRTCTQANLGTMLPRGVSSVRFAGGLWEMGERSGVTLALFAAPTITATILFEFYETGARTASKTDAIQTSDITVAGAAGRRLDVLNDESYQTIITWPAGDGTVRVVLVGSDVRETVTRQVHEGRVAAALAASAGASAPGVPSAGAGSPSPR